MVDPRVDLLEKQFTGLVTMMEGLIKRSDDQTRMMEKHAARVDSLLSKGSNHTGENFIGKTCDRNYHCGSSDSALSKLAKLDFPKYNGVEDPTSWVCRVEQFFEFQQLDEADKLPLTAYHLEGEAQMWYQLFKESEEVLTWAALKATLHKHYGPTAFDDLTKLHQTGSVREFQLQFERLLSRVGRLSTQHQLGCFVSGLKGNLRSEVQAAKPATVTEAIRLARLSEARNWSLKKPPISYGNRIRETTPPLPFSTLTQSKPSPTKRLSLRVGKLSDYQLMKICRPLTNRL